MHSIEPESHGAWAFLYTPPMILVVDDDPVFLEKAGSLLDDERRVFFAANAKQAFTLAQDLGFSVVLVDLDMPGEDGFELIRRMRQRFPELPIIAISGVFQGHVLESAKELGAAEVLSKPISPEWKETVERLRRIGREQRSHVR
jgi:CheY-like chemotaxis protein